LDTFYNNDNDDIFSQMKSLLR